MPCGRASASRRPPAGHVQRRCVIVPLKESPAPEYLRYEPPQNLPALLLADAPNGGRLHFHGCAELAVCHASRGVLQLGERRMRLCRGDVALIPPYLPHGVWPDEGAHGACTLLLFFPERLFPAENPFGPPDASAGWLFHAQPSGEVYALACAVSRELQRQEPGYAVCAQDLFHALLIKLARCEPCVRVGQPAAADACPERLRAVLPAVRYLEEHYAEPVSIAQLARLCRLSETHFRRCFRAVFGMAPLAYLNNLRVQKACALLRHSEDSILSVSECAGFATLSSFNRHFKQQTGLAPLAWRRAQAGAAPERAALALCAAPSLL